MYKYLQQLTLLGLANLSTIVPTSHPPLPCHPNSSSIELLGFANWLECIHPLAVEHVTRLTQTVWDWSHCLSGPHQDWMTPGGYVAPILTTHNIKLNVSSGEHSLPWTL